MKIRSLLASTLAVLVLAACSKAESDATPNAAKPEEKPKPPARNLLINNSLEELDETMKPKQWAPSRDKVNLVVDAQKAHSGKVALIASNDAFVSQAVTVQGDRDYKLSHYSRSEDGKGVARMQVNFSDDTGKVLEVKIDAMASGRDWVQHSYNVHSPAGATTAVIFLVPHSGEVWFDDVWFTEAQ